MREKNNSKLTYSKSSKFYTDKKKDFFSKNEQFLSLAESQNKFYSLQPSRSNCKICNGKLPNSPDFAQHHAKYVFCTTCNHLNGMNEDTKAFAETLYLRSDGKDYAKNYLDPNYQERTDLIYRPKLDFLLENLSPADEVELLDVGCGSGYFVYAALMANINAFGIDINQTMIDSGNQQILHLKNLEPLTYVGESKYFEIIANTTASVISAIGVIEHLRRPELFFNAFQSSKAQYLYFSVPMFSLSVIIENVMQGVFPRQLSGGHTHLFTEESIQWILRNWGLDSVAEWRFGTDIMDFYRSIRIEAEARGGSKKFMELIDGGLLKNIDKLQETLDNSHFCSEIHCLFKKI